jgi:hypothetical protein
VNVTLSAEVSAKATSSLALAFGGEYDESADLRDSDGLRQGDVLQLIPREPEAELERYFGVVVTANCDLAQNKHFGVVTYVPLVPVEFYIHRFTLPKVLDNEEVKSLRLLKGRILEKCDTILFDRVVDMMYSNSYTLDEISGSVSGQLSIRDEVARHLAVLSALGKAREVADPQVAIYGLVELASALDIILKPKKPTINGFLADIENRLTRSMAGDCIFLSQISSNHGSGYTAILRMIRELSHDRISLSASAEQRDPGQFSARRVSRLRTLYIHRLVQQMAQVFTDIGLPGEYETARDTVVSRRLRDLLKVELGN